MLLGLLLLNPDPAPGNGPPPVDQEKVTLKGILAKHGNDANAALIELAPILANMNRRIGALVAENTSLKSRTLPEGSVIVPAEKVKLWETVKDVSDEPKEVARRLKDFPAVEAELTGIKDRTRKEGLAKVARVDGRKVDPEVFAEFFGGHEMVVKEVKDRATGKVTSTLFVKHKDGEKDVETEFGEFAKKARPKLIPSLVPSSSETDDDEIEDIETEEDEETEAPARRSVLSKPDPAIRVGGPFGVDERRLLVQNPRRYH
jgi:hypothetical protein